MSDSFDLIVIGAGPGGYPAAIRASQLGLNVACVEKEKLGGVCLNWGCIPSKALLKTAELVHKIAHAADFGITAGTPEVDYAKVVARSRRVARKFEKGVGYLFKKYGVNRIEGTARLAGPGVVEVHTASGPRTLHAPHVVVATGGRARTFPGIAPDGERILTYREAIVSEERPASVAILGSGAIGIEFAYFWNAMGAEVTVVEGLPEILPREDAELAGELRKILAKQGIRFELGRFVNEVAATEDGTRTTLADGTVIEAARALVALGIAPNTEGVGLEEAGVRDDRGFVRVDAQRRTNVPGIWAVGDCTTAGGLAHTATAQGHAVAERIAGHDPLPVDLHNIPSCTYCQPGLASVGMTEAEARAAGRRFRVGRFPFSANGKAYGAGAPEGMVKVLIDDDYGEILGAHILGSEATEMIAEFVLARSSEATAEVLLHTVHAHPTHAEVSFEAVAQALGSTVHI